MYEVNHICHRENIDTFSTKTRSLGDLETHTTHYTIQADCPVSTHMLMLEALPGKHPLTLASNIIVENSQLSTNYFILIYNYYILY